MYKSYGTIIYDTTDIDLVMAMYDILECISNYSERTGYLWFYSENEELNFDIDIANSNNLKSFKYKTKILEDTVSRSGSNITNRVLTNATITVLVKCLIIF